MIKQVLSFASRAHLSTDKDQLVASLKETGEERRFPLEDIGLIELDSPQVTLTTALLQKALAHNVPIVIGDARHLPAGMLLATEGNVLQQKHQQAQVAADARKQKRLWQLTVRAKITNQATALELRGQEAATLHRLAKEVAPGDAENCEAAAAQYYWPRIFADVSFRRGREGPWPNNLLNYGYAILRAQTARALVAAGLLPALGIFHRNQYNAYPLADDLMEPFRPWIDLAVATHIETAPPSESLTKHDKALLLQCAALPARMGKEHPSLQTALHRACTSLARCYLGERTTIDYARLCPSIPTVLCGSS